MPTYHLLQPHRHGGKGYAIGEPIEVRKAVADRLPKTFGKPVNNEAPADKSAGKKE